MSDNASIAALSKVVEAAMEHSVKNTTQTNTRMDRLIDSQIKLTEEVSKLTSLFSASEVRHEQHSDNSERLGLQNKETRNAIETYKTITDDRISRLERFRIRMSTESKQYKINNTRKVNLLSGVIVAVIGAVATAWFTQM